MKKVPGLLIIRRRRDARISALSKKPARSRRGLKLSNVVYILSICAVDANEILRLRECRNL